MTSTFLVGATGMTGSHILSTLLSLPSSTISSIATISRRAPTSPPSPSPTTPKFNPATNPDTATWPASLPRPSPEIFISALATTRAAAGGFDKQYVLEHDLNVALAKQAKENGTRTYVLISSASASAASSIGYSRMKGEIEDHIKELGFERMVILRPGLIGGYREESRPAEALIRKVADGLGWVSGGRLKDFWAQDADVIARAAVRAGLEAGEKEKVWVVGQAEIVRLGRTEWEGWLTKLGH